MLGLVILLLGFLNRYYLLKTSRLNKSTAERSTDDALEAILEPEPDDDDFAC